MSQGPRQLRNLLKQPGLIPAMATHDVFTARIAEQAGVPLLFLGGFGVAASQFGWPDLGLVTLSEMAQSVARLTSAVRVPVIADADTGYGNERNVRRTVREYEKAGAAGLLLEDQVFPKRCGHFAGKEVIPFEDYARKLTAALDARHNDDFIIIARTDARAVLGIDEAIARAQKSHQLGAQIGFVEAPASLAELQRIASEVPGFQLANMLVGGTTPILSTSSLGSLGFKIAVSPIESLLATGAAVRLLVQAWLEQGRVDQVSIPLMSFEEIKQLLMANQPPEPNC